MRQAVIHIGSLKTGSTSVQDSFSRARAALAARGLHYASMARNHAFLSFSLRYADRFGFDDAQNKWSGATAQKALHRLNLAKAEAADFSDGTFMFSTESLFKSTPRRAAILKEMADEMFPGIPVKILAYIRHPVGYTISNGQERIKRTYATSADVEAEGYDGHLRRGIETFAKTFGRDALVLRSYDEAVAKLGAVEHDVLETLGVSDAAQALEIRRKNTSLSMNAVQVADALNRKLKAENVPLQRAQRTMKARLLRKLEGPKFALSAAALDRLREQSRADVDWFGEAFGLVLPEPKVTTREALAPEMLREKQATRRANAFANRVKAANERQARQPEEDDETADD
ncbi:hypothetical protein [Acuticoccus sp.]|uniref:hypothetical protein n=1 Tax=Acuticoccus sp. TaxID=1904378 RepID=UPI003B52F5D1